MLADASVTEDRLPLALVPAPRSGRVTIPEVTRMRHLYEVEGLSFNQIAACSGRPFSTVRTRLVDAGVTPRQPHAAHRPMPDRVPHGEIELTVELYRSGLSTRQVAALLDVSDTTVGRRLDRAGVARRSLSEAQALLAATGKLPEGVQDDVVRLYHDERWGLRQTAARAGVSVGTVPRVLARRGVRVRSSADAARIEWARREGRDVMTVPLQLRVRSVTAREADPSPSGWVKQYVASAPVAAAVAAAAAALDDDPAAGERMVAVQAGLSPRLLWSWRLSNRHLPAYRDRATAGSVERVLIAIDRMWWEVFDPEDHGEAVYLEARRLWGDAD